MRMRVLIAAALMLVPSAALAHPAISEAHGFVQGLAHPLGGLDHILAMVAVGVFAWQLGGRAVWAVPATFVLIMALGSMLGIADIGIRGVQIGIAASVIVLGAIVAFRVNASVAAAMGVVALFAIFHGHAHGAEMPLAAASVPYALGFMLATALLHLAGVALGFVIGRAGESYGRLGYRFAGGLVALAGIAILAQTI
jgi:urease accessory protein